MRFDCPVCGDAVTVPVRTVDSGKWAISAAVDLSVIRQHMTSVHPELAEPAGEAVTGDEPAEPVERVQSGR